MRYVISYDIDDDKIRNKLAKILEGAGVRVQYSVFECELTEKRFQTLYRKIFELTDGTMERSVRFYSLCKNCKKRIVTIGNPIKQIEEIQEETIII